MALVIALQEVLDCISGHGVCWGEVPAVPCVRLVPEEIRGPCSGAVQREELVVRLPETFCAGFGDEARSINSNLKTPRSQGASGSRAQKSVCLEG
jgi:hypothetical protein